MGVNIQLKITLGLRAQTHIQGSGEENHLLIIHHQVKYYQIFEGIHCKNDDKVYKIYGNMTKLEIKWKVRNEEGVVSRYDPILYDSQFDSTKTIKLS